MFKRIGSVGLFMMLITLAAAAQNTFPSSGNVGIGTTSPDQPLTVTGYTHITGNNQLKVDVGSTSGYFGNFEDSSGNWFGISYPSNVLQEFNVVNNAVAFPNGNVGIGTTSPGALLDVTGNVGGGANVTYLHMTDSNSVLHTLGIGANISRSAIGTTTNDDFAIFTNNGTDNIYIKASTGNVGIGTTSPGAPLEVHGNVLVSGTGAHVTYPDSTVQSTAWTGTLTGGDYAESVDISGDRAEYEPGDVLVLDPNHQGHFLKAVDRYSTLVAGVYSTRPGVMGRRQTTDKTTSTCEVPMAMVGIVPTKVSAENGPIKTGDLLVASSTPGHAMKGTDRDLLTGAVIGKAMGSLDSGTGVIEALISLQ